MVVMFFPTACEIGVEQERRAAPSTCTVQAPHNPAPQPNFVPVSCSVSRKTQSSGVSGETLTVRSPPFTCRVKSGMRAPIGLDKADHGSGNRGKGEFAARGSGGTKSKNTEDTKEHEGKPSEFPLSCSFVSFVVFEFRVACEARSDQAVGFSARCLIARNHMRRIRALPG